MIKKTLADLMAAERKRAGMAMDVIMGTAKHKCSYCELPATITQTASDANRLRRYFCYNHKPAIGKFN